MKGEAYRMMNARKQQINDEGFKTHDSWACILKALRNHVPKSEAFKSQESFWIQDPNLLKHYAINEHQELIYEPLNRHDERFYNKPKWGFRNQKLGTWNLDFGTWKLTTHGNFF